MNVRSDRPTRTTGGADNLVLALDIGGTKLAAGVVTRSGRVVSHERAPSRAERGPSAMLRDLLHLADRALRNASVRRLQIAAVGIACGGPLDPTTGTVLTPPNLPGWDRVPVGSIVAEALGIPTVVDNDATAASLAELWYGAGTTHGAADLVYLTVSTGVGGGLVLDGRPYRGAGGLAGELGHMTIVHEGRLCGCGRRGCLEAYVSGTSIAARAREAATAPRRGPGGRTALDPRDITAEAVARAAAAGDPLAGAVWRETTDLLGAAVATLLNVFDPELVVLGGGVTRAGDLLIEPVRSAALAQALPAARTRGDVVLTGLGDDIALLSAAAVAVEHLGGRPPLHPSPPGPAPVATVR